LKNLIFVITTLFLFSSAFAWDVDFSRRRKPASPENQTKSEAKPKLTEFISKAPRETNVDRQEIVILNTQKGFVPTQVRIKKGAHYMIHVVNVNKNNKNVSFMLDAYAQHHSTYFGETTSFKLDPDKEGIFEFQCPETSREGKLVVYGPQAQPVQVERSTATTTEE
jgi:hypothetical protein